MKQFKALKLKRIILSKVPRKNRQQIINQKPKIKFGRWSVEENKLFEKNYIAYLQKKITLNQLKNCIPTRTPAQTHCHINKKKYELDRKFCAVANKDMQAQILSINEFFENERIKNTGKVTQLIYLRDELKKKNYVISLESFILLKKFFPKKAELKLDFQAIHNFLLAVKTEREYAEMLQRHDSEMNRETSNLGKQLQSKSDNSTVDSSLNSHPSTSLSPAKLRTPSESCASQNFFCVSKEENYECNSVFNNNKFSEMRTADCTPMETKIPAAPSSNKTENTNLNFISEFGEINKEKSAEANKNSKHFIIKNQKYLNFNSDESSENSNFNRKTTNTENSYGDTDAFYQSKRSFDPKKIFACENPLIPKSQSYLNKGTKDSNLFFVKKDPTNPQCSTNKYTDLAGFINLKEKQSFNNASSSPDNEDSYLTLAKSLKSNEVSSDIDSFFDSNCDFSRPNTEDAHVGELGDFFCSQSEKKANFYNSRVFSNPFNFSFGKNLEQQDLGNKDTSVLFDDLIFSLCSNSNSNNNNNISKNDNVKLDSNFSSNNTNNNFFPNAGLTSDFYSDGHNTLSGPNANCFSCNIHSTNNHNCLLSNNNNGFNLLYPVEAEFYKDNTGFKFDQLNNFLY